MGRNYLCSWRGSCDWTNIKTSLQTAVLCCHSILLSVITMSLFEMPWPLFHIKTTSH